MYKITQRDLQNTIDFWDSNCHNIMESQRKYNEEAIEWSRKRFEKWIGELNEKT